MLRMLAASHIITETSKETYKATPFSKALTVKENRDFMKTTYVNSLTRTFSLVVALLTKTQLR